MEDKTLVCRDCGKEFVWTVGEQEFYQQKGFDQAPTRCPDCRRKHKAQKSGDRGERAMHPAVCSKCGKDTMVPFVPRGDKPVLCNDCYAESRGERYNA